MNRVLMFLAVVFVALTAVSCLDAGASVSDGRTVLYYANPMDPSIKSDVPAKDPMGMDYIPVYADSSTGQMPEGVTISGPDALRINLRTAVVEFRPFGQTIKAIGRISHNERSWVHVSARFGGRVETLAADYTGIEVKAGSPLMTVYSPALVAAQNELLQLRRRVGSVDDPLLAIAKEKLKLLGLSEIQLEGILASGKALHALPVLSPISGTVIAKSVVAGMYVTEGEMMFEIADLSRLWMEAEIFEQDLARISVGASVEMVSVAHPGVNFSGEVSFISPVLDPQTRTVKIRTEVDNRRGLLKPNMYVEARIIAGEAVPRLVIPSTAVLDTGVRKIVYVDQGDGRFVGHRVLTGPSSEGWTTILAGLEVGDHVAVSGAFLIDSQAQLTGAREVDYQLPTSRL